MPDSNPSDHSTAQNSGARQKRRVVQSLKARADAKRSRSEQIADWITDKFGTMVFFVANGIFFAVWLILNTAVIPGVEPFDPFPFGLLTTIVSLEAIALAILVLISQNRAARIADLREEIDLQVDMAVEAELTKLLEMVNLLLEKHDINLSDDDDLRDMLQPTDIEQIEHDLEQQVVNGKLPESS